MKRTLFFIALLFAAAVLVSWLVGWLLGDDDEPPLDSWEEV